MKRFLSIGVALALLLVVGIYCAFPHPSHNRATLKAIRAESLVLIASKRAHASLSLPESQWTPTIVGLHPAFIIVYSDSIDIVTKPFFDGGWGYRVSRNEGWPEPAGRYSKLDQGVFWFHPY